MLGIIIGGFGEGYVVIGMNVGVSVCSTDNVSSPIGTVDASVFIEVDGSEVEADCTIISVSLSLM